MKYHTINSTAISGVGYSEETGQMEVIFATGSTAMHEGVSKEKFDTFMAAKSKGRAYSEMFRVKKQDQPKQVTQNFKIG